MTFTTALGPPVLGPAALVLGFVNTRSDGSGRVERLADGNAFVTWAQDAELTGPGLAATAADAASARELREALVTVLLAHSDPDDDGRAELDAAEHFLRRAASRHPLVAVVTADELTLVSEQPGVPGVLGTVLAAVAELASSDVWSRLKACQNPPCHFGFVDRTRNGSGKYCSTGCGSQVSMRTMRSRRRAESAGPSS
ncbi:CGNR zinc finger domain-containing protein [Nocardioides sp.]|uniref:CGNR zinc finger domain-containing protein n=1 Tax=Nocardioides sp. TaxID=35761 RepID=UPI002BF0458D|nr:CGNR zinc finger domain-containing protein [Nocardioides sp.]HXH79257.1 CGNR zinc finger domain-containing protein [Nocardioides sp.]